MLAAFHRNGRLNFDALHDSLVQALGSEPGQAERTASYPVDIREDKNSFYVDAELPGYTRDQIQVTLDKGVLEIVATKAPAAKPAAAPAPTPEGTAPQAEAPKPETATHLRERSYTRIARAFRLPENVDEGKIQGKLENGVLYLTLGKREEVRPRKVQID